YQYFVWYGILIDALFAKSLGNFKSRKEIEDYLTEKIHDLGIRQLILKNIYSNSNKSYKWKSNISGIKNNFDLIFEPIESKNTFLNPTLFIRGELSNYILDEDIAGIKKLFPTSQFETIKMASHWVQADKPKELVDLIIEFVKL
ncbi:MAG: alpha/beta hydrolase, partial [Bacteroidetes bacterium]|nr:alpha/beta hydrolase [Bacteroidota bacterium]